MPFLGTFFRGTKRDAVAAEETRGGRCLVAAGRDADTSSSKKGGKQNSPAPQKTVGTPSSPLKKTAPVVTASQKRKIMQKSTL